MGGPDSGVTIVSDEIRSLTLHKSTPWYTHLYGIPFFLFYPVLAYVYYFRYDEWLGSQEWTFLACVILGLGHSLSFLFTRWNTSARARITTKMAKNLLEADCVRIMPFEFRGKGAIVSLERKDPNDIASIKFVYHFDTYIITSTSPPTFERLPYPCSQKPPILNVARTTGLTTTDISNQVELYGGNEFHIPIPSFTELFGEHATAPFFVFQIFCVGLWLLDEYWYYSLFTLFMLVVFECTTVWQRLNALKEFQTMSLTPYPIQCYRNKNWVETQTNQLLPGDLISLVKKHGDVVIPADILLIHGGCIVNEAMLTGESVPLLKESISSLDQRDSLDIDSAHKTMTLFGGTKLEQASNEDEIEAPVKTPDGGCLGVVLRTGFGTSQGQLVRTMIFSQDRVSANNTESFLFIGFLLIFAIAASWYVWVKGVEKGLKKSKLLLDCILVVTSVVPPELPMELSLAVNASLAALHKYAIYCTEPFRIPFAGRVDVCCFDKTGTITTDEFKLEGVVGVVSSDPKKIVPLKESSRETVLCAVAAQGLGIMEDGTVVGDPLEKTTLQALDWQISKGQILSPKGAQGQHRAQIHIRHRFHFQSDLKRMSTISTLPNGKIWVATKGAPETLRGMFANVPIAYDETYKWYTRRGRRVLALGYKEMDPMSREKITGFPREKFESQLLFGGFLIFNAPLKEDAIATLQMLADSSHRCIMITGDNPLTAVHVAQEVEIVDREVLILDIKEDAEHEADLAWRTVDESKIISVNPEEPLDTSLLDKYDVCITGTAMKHFEHRESWKYLVQNTWVYARVSPAQKGTIVTSLRSLGYITLMAGDGTNDVGALKQAHIGVALLNGTVEDLKKIAERQRLERIKKVYESQLKISARFGQPPPPVPPAIAHLLPDAVQAQQRIANQHQVARQANPMEKFDLNAITDKLAEMEGDEDVPQIKPGDASCAAPFTSKLSNVSSVSHIIRQGRCTLVATIQMYKILALNCLITAYSLSVQYLDGIKFGDYQVTISGMLMSVCFLCISRAKPVEKLSRERPLGYIFNVYVMSSILLQFSLHIAALVYITTLTYTYETREEIDLEAKFEPNLLNTAIYLLSLSQQVSTFAINYQGRPFREGIRENPTLWWGLIGASTVAFSGAMDLFPDLNRWLQIVVMENLFMYKLTVTMAVDFVGCWIIENVCKYFFADLEPRDMITKGRERREQRRRTQKQEIVKGELEKKTL